MSKNILQNNLFVFVALTILSFFPLSIKAEGSKEANPTTAIRATLQVAGASSSSTSWPFMNNGRHYVYAKAGEKITLGADSGTTFRVTSPSGTTTSYTNSTNNGGVITGTNQETAGAKKTTSDNTSNTYLPIYYNVTTSGIYRIEFSRTENYLSFWDISVLNSTSTAFTKGRVFTSVLSINQTNSYATYYVLTIDGYTYRVNLNGMNGIYYTFLANNTGFVDSNTRNPTYKSINSYTTTSISSFLKSPNLPNTTTEFTHKIFYNLPSSDLVAYASAPYPLASANNGNVPLRITPPSLDVNNIELVGSENTPGQISTQGGKIKFSTVAQGSYTVIIKDKRTTNPFPTRKLTGTAVLGLNEVQWDGKDGNGNLLNVGVHNVQVNVQLMGAEVHFPYFDIENNANGIIIELLDNNYSTSTSPTVVSNIIYWDDTPISTTLGAPNPKNNSHLSTGGTNSTTNGHRFTNNFGDTKALDTWTFISGQEITKEVEIIVKTSELKITSLTTNKTIVSPGTSINYTIKAKNEGPSDVLDSKFTLQLPSGITAQSIQFLANGNCGQEAQPLTYNSATQTYTSLLNLPNGCEITYQITAIASNNIIPGNGTVKASILRPRDVSDPDATNTNPNIPNYNGPTDIDVECANNGLNGVCNNIKRISILQDVEEICSKALQTTSFNITPTSSANLNIANTDLGFNIDIFRIQDIMNVSINGTPIVNGGFRFLTNTNIRFQDGTMYNVNTDAINTMVGSATSPLIRISVDSNGNIVLFGSKVSNGPLFNLELLPGNYFNTIVLNTTNQLTLSTSSNGNSITGNVNTLSRKLCVCSIPPQTSGTPSQSYVGITSLKRAGSSQTSWPINRNGGALVLESNTKGFVITRLSKIEIEGQTTPTIISPKITQPEVGMMVYDTTDKCLKIYSGSQWKCFSKPTCPN